MKYKIVLKDLYGYILNSTKQNVSAEQILSTVIHDLQGTVNKEACFALRSSGQYEAYLTSN